MLSSSWRAISDEARLWLKKRYVYVTPSDAETHRSFEVPWKIGYDAIVKRVSGWREMEEFVECELVLRRGITIDEADQIRDAELATARLVAMDKLLKMAQDENDKDQLKAIQIVLGMKAEKHPRSLEDL